MTTKLNAIVIIMCCSTALFAQRTQIQLQLKTNQDVIYKEPTASVGFTKADIISEFNDFRSTSVFNSYPPGTQFRFQSAIDWLKDQTEVIINTEEKLQRNQRILAELLQTTSVGTQLLQRGKANVLNSQQEVVKTIEYEIEKPFDKSLAVFYFLKNSSPFFIGGTVPALIEVKMEPVHEEPVETIENSDEDRTFTVVEEMPTYPGGMTKFADYLQANLRYPKKSKKERIEGTVFVSFVVKKDGSLTGMSVIKGLDGPCNEEALRLVRESGQWQPGKQNGKVVNVKFVYPIKFRFKSK